MAAESSSTEGLPQLSAELHASLMELRFLRENGYEVPQGLREQVTELLLAKGRCLGLELPTNQVVGTFVNIAALRERNVEGAPPQVRGD